MNLYIIGPVTGIDNGNLPRFTRARIALEGSGYGTDIPHDHIPHDAEWDEAMKASLKHLLDADGVALLTGWHDSKGACLEYDVARKVGIPAYTVDFWLENASRFAKGGAE